MNRKGEALLASTLSAATFAVAGCSAFESEPQGPVPAIELQTPQATEQEPEIVPVEAPGSHTRELLAKDAPIKLIFIPVIGQKAPKPEFQGDTLPANRRAIIAGNAKMLRSISRDFATATDERYTPSSITVVKTGAIALKSCVNNDDAAQTASIQTHAEQYRDENALNILVVDRPGCKMGESEIAGFASADMDPILATGAFGAFGDVAIHEAGHSGGLDHGGEADCKDVVDLQDCEVHSTADPNTIMSYTSAEDSHDFTSPELLKLGLLDKTEIIDNPKSGRYALVDAASKGQKVLRVPTPDGQTLYFSWEKSEDAEYDTTCHAEKPEDYESPDMAYSGTAVINRKNVNYNCFKVNKTGMTHEVQTRYDVSDPTDPSLAVVTRPDRAPDRFEGEQRDTGENQPGKILYRDETIEVKVIGHQGNTKAIVQVTRK